MIDDDFELYWKKSKNGIHISPELDEIVKELSFLAYQYGQSRYTSLKEENARIRTYLISGFYEEEYPTFKQGEPTHELESLVTADEVQGYVNKLAKLQKELDWQPITTAPHDRLIDIWIKSTENPEFGRRAINVYFVNRVLIGNDLPNKNLGEYAAYWKSISRPSEVI